MSDMDFDFGAEFAAFGDDLKGAAYSGDYTMLVKSAKPSRTQKGKMQLNVTLAFQGGPLGAKNKTVDDRLVWSPESDVAARIFAQTLAKLGAPQDWIMAERPTPLEICERITGTVVEVNLKADEWNGQPTTRVNYRKTVSTSGGPAAPSKTAAAAVSLEDDDDEEQVDTTTGEAIKEPASVGAKGAASPAGDEDPWA